MRIPAWQRTGPALLVVSVLLCPTGGPAQERAVLQEGGLEQPSLLRVSADGRRLLVGSTRSRQALVWDTASGRLLRGFPLSFDASLSADGSTVLFNDGARPPRFQPVDSGLEPVALNSSGLTLFVAGGRSVAVAPQAGGLVLHDARTGKEALVLQQPVSGLSFHAVSSDAATLAGCTQNGKLVVWDLERRQSRTLQDRCSDGQAPKGVFFTPDNRHLGLTYHSGTTQLWEVGTWKPRGSFAGNPGSLAVGHGGKVIAVRPALGAYQLRDLDGKELGAFDASTREAVEEVELLADDRLLAVRRTNGEIALYHAVPDTPGFGKERLKILNAGETGAAVLGRDGKTVHAVSGNGLAWRWAPGSDRPDRLGNETASQAPAGPVSQAQLSADGKYLLAHSTGRLWIWDTGTRREVHTGPASAAEMLPDGTAIFGDVTTRQVKLWTPDREALALAELPAPPLAIQIVRSGQLALTTAGNSAVLIDLTTRQLWATLKDTRAARLSPDGQLLVSLEDAASGGRARTVVRRIAFAPGKPAPPGFQTLAEFDDGNPTSFPRVRFSTDAKRLILPAGPGLRLLDTATGKALALMEQGNASAFSADGRWLATAHTAEAVAVWDASNGKRRATLKGLNARATQLRFDPTGKRLWARAVEDAAVWDLATLPDQSGEQPPVLEERHPLPPYALAGWSSAAGQGLLVSGSGYVGLWDLDGGKEVTRYRKDNPRAVTMTTDPEGERLLTGHADGSVRIWNVDPDSKEFGRESGSLPGVGTPVQVLRVAPDGRWAGTTSEGGQVRLWRLDVQGELVRPGRVVPPATELSFSADSERVVVRRGGSVGTGWTLWETATGKVLSQQHVISPSILGAHPSRIVVTRGKGGLSLLDPVTAGETAVLVAPSYAVTRLASSADGKVLASGHADGSVRLWDSQRGTLLKSYRLGNRDIHHLAISDDAKVLLASDDTTYRFWNVAADKPISEPILGRITGGTLSPDGSTLLPDLAANPLPLVDTATGKARAFLSVRTPGAMQFVVSRDGTVVLAMTDGTFQVHTPDGKGSLTLARTFPRLTAVRSLVLDGSAVPGSLPYAVLREERFVVLLDLSSGKEVARLEGHAGTISQYQFSPDGKALLTRGGDGARLWNVDPTSKDFGKLRFFTPEIPEFSPLALSPRWTWLAVTGRRGRPEVWDLTTGKAVTGDGPAIGEFVTGFLDENRLLTARTTGEVRAWDLRKLSEGGVLYLRAPHLIRDAHFTGNGKTLLSLSFKGQLRIWDVARGTLRREWDSGQRQARLADLSPDGTLAAVITLQAATNNLKIWNLNTGREGFTLRGLKETAQHASFSHDGKFLATVTQQGKVQLWEVPGGTEKGSWQAADGALTGVVFSPDGRYLLTTTGTDRTSKTTLWGVGDAALGKVITTLEGAPGRPGHRGAFSETGKLLALSNGADTTFHDMTPGQSVGAKRATIEGLSQPLFVPGKPLVVGLTADGLNLASHNAAEGATPLGKRLFSFPRTANRIIRHDVASGVVLLCDARGNVRLFDLEGKLLASHFASLPGQVVLSPDGKELSLATSSGGLSLASVPGTTQRFLQQPAAGSTMPTLSPDRSSLATGFTDGTVELLHRTRPPVSLVRHAHPVGRLTYSNNGKVLASADESGLVCVWDVATGVLKRELKLPPSRDLCFLSSDGATLAVRPMLGPLQLWDTATGRLKRELLLTPVMTTFHLITALDRLLINQSGVVTQVDLSSDQPLPPLVRPFGIPRQSLFLPDGQTVVLTHSLDGTIGLFDTSTGKPRRMLQGHTQPVTQVVVTPNGKGLVSAGLDGQVLRWNLEADEAPSAIECHAPVTHMAFLPENKGLALVGIDGSVRLVEEEKPEGRWLRAPGVPATQAHFVAGSPLLLTRHSGDYLVDAGASAVRYVTAWNWDSAEPLRTWFGAGHLEVSANGKLAALSFGYGEIKLVELPSLKERCTIHHGRQLHGSSERLLWLSPDGKILAYRSSSGAALTAYATDTGTSIFTLPGSYGPVEYSRDGRSLLIFDSSLRFCVHDLSSGSKTASIPLGPVYSQASAQSPDGKYVAYPRDFTTALVELETGKERILHGRSYARRVAFSNSGKALVAQADNRVVVFDVATGIERVAVQGTQSFSALALSPKHELAALGTGERVRLLDLNSGKDLFTLRVATSPTFISALAFDETGTSLAVASGTGLLKVYHARLAPRRNLLTGPRGAVHALAASPDGKWLVTAGDGPALRVWEMPAGKLVTSLTGHRGLVLGLAFSPDGKRLASAGADGRIRLWAWPSFQPEAVLEGHEGAVWAVAFSPDGKTLASGGADRTARLWDVETSARGKERAVFRNHQAEVLCVAFRPDGKVLATGEGDVFASEGPARGRLWDLSNGEEVGQARGHSHAIRAILFSRDGKTLWTGSWDRTVRGWEVPEKPAGKTLTLRQTFSGHGQPIQGLALSPDGQTLASAGGNLSAQQDHGEVFLWDLKPGKPRPQFCGHRSGLMAVTFSADGKSVLAGSLDESVPWWDLTEK